LNIISIEDVYKKGGEDIKKATSCHEAEIMPFFRGAQRVITKWADNLDKQYSEAVSGNDYMMGKVGFFRNKENSDKVKIMVRVMERLDDKVFLEFATMKKISRLASNYLEVLDTLRNLETYTKPRGK